MNCECGSRLERITGSVVFPSKVIGKTVVPGLKMDHCPNCGLQLLLPGESEKLTKYVLERESERVGLLPISSFISEVDAATFLNQSKQALNKNKKIRAGFIMFAILSARRWYLKESVEKFKAIGDGRFFLGTSLRTQKK